MNDCWIDAAIFSDVAVRYLCANHHPDHDSICTFRTANKQAFEAAFASVLQLACISPFQTASAVCLAAWRAKHDRLLEGFAWNRAPDGRRPSDEGNGNAGGVF
jgi:hypothetical protein